MGEPASHDRLLTQRLAREVLEAVRGDTRIPGLKQYAPDREPVDSMLTAVAQEVVALVESIRLVRIEMHKGNIDDIEQAAIAIDGLAGSAGIS